MKNYYKYYKQAFVALLVFGLSFAGYGQQEVSSKLIVLNQDQKFTVSEAENALKSVYQEPDSQSSGDVSFVELKRFTDQLGYQHIKFQEYYKGVPVAFSHFYEHVDGGLIKSVNGDHFSIDDVDVNPSLSAEAALQSALTDIGAKEYLWQSPRDAAAINYKKPKGKLVVLPDIQHADSGQQKPPRLAYKFDIYATNPESRAYVYVDAHTGEILYKDLIMKHAVANGTADTRYSGRKNIKTDSYGTKYRLRDYSRGGGIETYDLRHTNSSYGSATDFTDNDNNWTAAEYDNTNKDNAALDAHYAAQVTYDYWKNKHNRNSYDGNDSKLISYVHWGNNIGNAQWTGSAMRYGDGDNRFDALTCIDVGAHEIGHAVCQSTANLTYDGESGALNEALSDIWGACVEHYAAPDKKTWLMGEEIVKSGTALRSMKDPKSLNQPDTYHGSKWYYGSADYHGVHTNSGVANYWFYLTSEGGSGTNDNNDSYNVTGVGIDKAAKITYRAESVYMTASTNYANARTYTIKAAKDLYGAGSAEEKAVTNAWHAVGVGAAYSDGSGGGGGGGGGSSSYCKSKGKVVTDEYIQRVKLNTIDKSSVGNGYSDFTSASTKLSKGSSYTITVTPKWTGQKYSEGYAVWIDYNHDGDFTDSGERVFSKSATTTSPVSGSFTVPSGATTGKTRMRVSMKYNGIPTSCETFNWGEVEDYTVDISTGSGGGSPSPSNYCKSKGQKVRYEHIQRVKLNTINNSSGAIGYSDFTSISTNLSKGSSYTVTVTPKWTGTSAYSEGYAVWIDYNQDGDFTDSGERVFVKSATTASSVSGSFTVPSGAKTGKTRMRVSMKWNGVPTPCETFEWGEVEDYTVNIGGGSIYAFAASTKFNLYPNPASTILNVELGDQTMDTYTIMNYMGQVVVSRKLESSTIDVSQLKKGVYIIKFSNSSDSVTKRFIKK